MKKILSFFLGLLFVPSGITQEIKVTSVSFDSNEVLALKKPIFDLNDEICALVVLKTQGVDGIEIKGSIASHSSLQNTHYLYLPNKTKRIAIYHHNYLPLTINFNELFNTSFGLKGGKTYNITIEGGGAESTMQNKPNYTNGSNYLSFESTIPFTRLVVNGQEWQLNKGKPMSKMVRCGEYEYSASANGHSDVSGTVIVKKSINPVVVSIQFEK